MGLKIQSGKLMPLLLVNAEVRLGSFVWTRPKVLVNSAQWIIFIKKRTTLMFKRKSCTKHEILCDCGKELLWSLLRGILSKLVDKQMAF